MEIYVRWCINRYIRCLSRTAPFPMMIMYAREYDVRVFLTCSDISNDGTFSWGVCKMVWMARECERKAQAVIMERRESEVGRWKELILAHSSPDFHFQHNLTQAMCLIHCF